MIQIYDAIVKSGVKWAEVKHLGWTKLRAIAGVLDGENADRWIKMASKHSKAEIIKAVQEQLAGSAGQKPGDSIATQVKTFKFRADRIKTVQAAIDSAKKLTGETHDSAAMEAICQAYIDLQITITLDTLIAVVRRPSQEPR